MRRHILLIFLVTSCWFCGLHAEQMTISIHDTIAKSGVITLPVYGSTANISGNIEYTLKLSGAECSIFSIAGGQQFGFIDPLPAYNLTVNTDGSRNLHVRSSSVQPNFSGILFEIKISIFPKVDFYSKYNIQLEISPMFFAVDSAKTDFDSVKSGIITIQPTQAIQTYNEEFSYNYPNPFSYETEIFFSIDEETPITIYIYNYNGDEVQRIPYNDMNFYCTFVTPTGEVLKIDESYKFKRGLYKLVLRPKPTTLEMGSYYLVFETNKNKHTLNMLYVK